MARLHVKIVAKNDKQQESGQPNGVNTARSSWHRDRRWCRLAMGVVVGVCLHQLAGGIREFQAMLSSVRSSTCRSGSSARIHNPGSAHAAAAAAEPFHVLFGLAGNQDGFFAEFDVALKSVLLNAPHRAPLHVHIMADQAAHDKLYQDVWPRIFPNATRSFATTSATVTTTTTTTNGTQQQEKQQQQATNQPWFTNVTITTYNVESHLKKWQQFIDVTTHHAFRNLHSSHTIGTYFRLFAHDVIHNKNVEQVLYMDTDVLILANLEPVFAEAPTTKSWMFQTSSQCVGFGLIHLTQMTQFWQLISQIDFSNRTTDLYDQDLVLAVQEVFDNTASGNASNTHHPDNKYVWDLSEPWDLYITRDWRHSRREALLKYRPQVGSIHYNGGGGSDEAYFLRGPFVNDANAKDGWGIAATFYRDLPWSWAFYMGESMMPRPKNFNTQIRLESVESKPREDDNGDGD